MSTVSIAHMITTWQNLIDRIDIELILAFVLNKDRTFILAHPEYILTRNNYKRSLTALRKRARSIPLAYIIGHKEFFGRTFHVTIDTLVPRPETEMFISLLTQVPQRSLQDALIIDVGTGSGIIAITLACEFHETMCAHMPSIIATDISHNALRVAKQNARIHHMTPFVKFFRSDLLCNTYVRTQIASPTYKTITLTANLPYVNIAHKKSLLAKKESRALRHEPSIALWASEHGLWYYKKIIRQVLFLKKKFPQKKFTLLCEIVPDQVDHLHTFLTSCHIPTEQVELTHDLAGKARIYTIKY